MELSELKYWPLQLGVVGGNSFGQAIKTALQLLFLLLCYVSWQGRGGCQDKHRAAGVVLFSSVIIAWPIGNISGFVRVFWGGGEV